MVTGVSLEITKLESVEGTAQSPGDVAGPSVRVTLKLTNNTSAALDLSTAVTNVYYGADDTPGQQLPGPDGSPLPTSVAAGKSVTAVLIFSVPKAERADVSITFDYSVGVPVVLFEGSAPS